VTTDGDAAGYVHDAEYVFEYDAPDRARVVADSVGREVGEIDDDRSRTALDRRGATVVVTVEARDLVALRAATNTWLGLVDVAERVARTDGLDPD
jgi:KEOPS complex subunit Pcc1